MPRSLHVPGWLKASLPQGPHVRRIPFGGARGLLFTVDFDEHLRFFLGRYEAELTPWLRRFATPGTVAYDVGADVGYQALVIARLTQSQVIAFEPRSESGAQIERHYELNRAQIGPIEVVRSAVGLASGREVVSLDAFRGDARFGDPGLLFVDVDGAEVDVLQGASALLADVRPHLIVETHSATLERECLALLHAAGYEPVVVGNRKLFGDYRPIAHNRWIAAAGV
jgi:hypothetical protein